jgi:tetratricopeptide (TPR) repeat protein
MRILKKYFFLFCFVFTSFRAIGQTKETDSLLLAVKESTSDTQTVTLYNKIGKDYNDRNDPAAVDFAKKAIALSTKIGFDKGLGVAYGVYATAVGNSGNFSEEVIYHNKAISIWEHLNNVSAQAKEMGNLAIAEWNMGDYTPATDHCLQSIRLFDKAGDKFGEAISRMTLGNIYFDKKNYPEAINCYKESRKLNDASKKAAMFEVGLLIDIGNVYNRKKSSDSALYFYNEALPIMEKSGSVRQKSILLNNIGTIYEDEKKYDEAMDYFRKSYNLRIAIGDSDGVCSVYQNLGNVYEDRQQYDSALYYYDKALGMSIRMRSRSQQATCYNDMFTCYV